MELYLPLILDGATGTELQKMGYKGEICAEQWTLDHPDVIIAIQKGYIDAGSNIVYTPTFGGNRVKLEENGIFNKTEEYNEKLAQRGEELLNNTDILIQSFECESLPIGNFKYKTHYDLGDIVTVKKDDWGIQLDLRITEISEIYENGSIKILPTFGNPLPDSIDWEDK